MATFTAQIGYYAGATSDYTSEITQWLADGVKATISRAGAMNPDLLHKFSASTPVWDGGGYPVTTKGRVLLVERDSSELSSDVRRARPVNPQFKNQIGSTTSLYYAPPEDPKYYIENGVLYVKPTPTATQPATISSVVYGAVSDTSTPSIATFPEEFYKHVVLWVAMNVLHAKTVAVLESLPTDLDTNTIVFDDISDFSETMSLATSVPSAFSVSSGLPSAIALSSSLPSAFNITTSLPSAISVSTSLPADWSITDFPVLYPMPNIDSHVADALQNAQYFIDYEEGLGITTDVEVWLNNEDVEMVDSVLQSAATELQRAGTALQKYQAEQQSKMNDWRQEVEKYQAVVTSESQSMQAQIQKYQAELQADVEAANSELSKYQADVQRESQRTGVDIQNYQSELELKTAQMNQEVSKHQSDVSAETARIQSELARYQAEVGKESARIQSELAEYQANIAKKFQSYSAKIQKETAAYQWLQGQLQYVKSMYEDCWAPYQGAAPDQNTSYIGVRK